MRAATFALAFLLFAAASRAQSLKELCSGVQYDLLPHPDDHAKFVVCAYEVPEVRSCGTEECFDAVQRSCSKAACNVVEPSDLSLAKSICESLNRPERIPSADCGHFWICLSSMEPVYVTCPQNKHYSRSDQECVSPAVAKCAKQETLCASELSSYPGESCNTYYGCANKKLEKRVCPYGEAYSAESGACVKDTNFSCEANSKPDCANPANANAFFAHSDCSRFYFCRKSEVYEGKCANGYGYDPKSENCRPGICKSD